MDVMAGAQAALWEFKQLKPCAKESGTRWKEPIPCSPYTNWGSWLMVFIYVGEECTSIMFNLLLFGGSCHSQQNIILTVAVANKSWAYSPWWPL